MDATTITSGCGLCGTEKCPIRCDSCQVISYCSREHKAAHSRSHLGICLDIKSHRTGVMWAESRLSFNTKFVLHPCKKLRRYPSGALGRRLQLKGLSWKEMDESVYMKSRLKLARAMSGIRTRESLQAQLTHVMDVLRMSDSDENGLRNLAPVLMLRLNQDLDCYNFLKWWTGAKVSRSKRGCTDKTDPGLWLQAIGPADFFEPVDFVQDLAHTIIMTLLKIKILLDIRNFDFLASGSREEVSGTFFRAAARNSIASDKCKLMLDSGKRQELIGNLLMQIGKLYDSVAKKNGYYWPALVAPESPLEWETDRKKQDFFEDMQDIWGYTHDAWKEVSGAIDFIRAKVENEAEQKVRRNAHEQTQDQAQDQAQDQVESQVQGQIKG